MLMDPMGGIVMTNDGNAILREVSHLHVTFNAAFTNSVLSSDTGSLAVSTLNTEHSEICMPVGVCCLFSSKSNPPQNHEILLIVLL